jgi:hypothetical protein
MARAINRLKAVTAAKATKPGFLADGGGLYLRIGPTGSKSWIFRYRRDGKLHDMGLGPLHTISLAEAREKAQECRKLRLDEIDPIEARRAGRTQAKLAVAATVTFRECADRYIAAHRAGWKSAKHPKAWTGSLTAYAHPVLGDLPIQAIDTGLVMKAIEPIWTEKPETASRENPARWRGHLEKLLPSRGKGAPGEAFRSHALPQGRGVPGRAAGRAGHRCDGAAIGGPDRRARQRSGGCSVG